MDVAGRMIRRGILGGGSGTYRMELVFQSPGTAALPPALSVGHLVATQPIAEDRHTQQTHVEWSPDDPDALVISRLKQATAAVQLHEERVTVSTATLEVAAPPSPQRDPASVEAGDPEPQSPERGPESREDPAAPAGSLGLSEPGPRSSEDVQSLPPSNTGVAEDLQGGSSAVHIVPPRGSRMSRDSRSMDGSTPAGDGHPVPPGGETMRRHSMDGDDGDSQKKTVPSVTGMDVEPDEATLAQTDPLEDYGEPDEEGPGGNPSVSVRLDVTLVPPVLRHVEFSRQGASGSPSSTLLATLMQECKLEEVWRLRCTEGLVPIWEPSVLDRLHHLRLLNLNHCALPSIPPGIGALGTLRELRVSHNKLMALPREIGNLVHLQKLVADHNLLTSLPVEIRQCTALRELSLESNRLATPVLDLRQLAHLRSLQLYGNPLEFLPDLATCFALRHLSLANVRLRADLAFTQWDVEVTGTGGSYIGRAPNKLAGLYTLIFRRSSCQHPLMAGALAKVAEDAAQCASMAKEVGALQQLLLMAICDDDTVVEQACKTIDLLGRHVPSVTEELLESDVVGSMLGLLRRRGRIRLQLAALRVLSSLAATSLPTAERLLRPDLVDALLEAVQTGTDDVRAAALEVVGNLAYPLPNREPLLAAPGLREWLTRLASPLAGVKQRVRVAAVRALAILGENEAVRVAVGRPAIRGRGVRILSMDGGGMKGIAIIRLLRQLEERTGRRIHQLFDLVCGTSTGGILAAATSIKHFSLSQCEDIYRTLGQQVFSKATGGAPEKGADAGWRDSLYSVYRSGQASMRVAVYGCKHDAALFEQMLRDLCVFDRDAALDNTLIDSAGLGTTKCFVVATLTSTTPAEPFIFRNYEYPGGSQAVRRQVRGYSGSSRHQVWQALRASSAAPYYLEDFKCGEDRWQDGAATANNPAVLAVQEARLLWPDVPLECLVSLGCGTVPLARREKSMSAYLDTGAVLIESACGVAAADAALSALCPLIPGLSYFRFAAEDPRCGIELDETDPEQWAQLEAATDDYIAASDRRLDDVARLLLHNLAETASQPTDDDVSEIRLGARRSLLVVTAPPTVAGSPVTRDVEAVADACRRLPQCVGTLALGERKDASERDNKGAGIELAHSASRETLSAAEVPVHSSEVGSSSVMSVTEGGGHSPKRRRTSASPLAMELPERVSGEAGRLGVIHLALHGDEEGLIDGWRHDFLAVADPSAEAAALVEEAGLAGSGGSLADLMAVQPALQAGNDLYSLLSVQTQVPRGVPVSSFLFERTRPSSHFTPPAASALRACWERRVVVTSAVMPRPLARAILEAGARAVICRDAAAPRPSPQDAADYFQAFYSSFLSGRSIIQALLAAGNKVDALETAFVACCLRGGQLEATQLKEGQSRQPASQAGLPPSDLHRQIAT